MSNPDPDEDNREIDPNPISEALDRIYEEYDIEPSERAEELGREVADLRD